MSNNITIMNERDKRIVDNIDMANSVLIFVNRIEIIAANNDSAVDDTIDTKVSPITFVFLNYRFHSFLLLQLQIQII